MSSSSSRRGRVKDAAAAAAITANVVAEHDHHENDDDGGVWVGVDFGTTHCSVAVWDSTRGFPKWMRLGQHGLAATTDSAKVGRLVPSQILLRGQQQQQKRQAHTNQNDTSANADADDDDDVWQDVSDLVHAHAARDSPRKDETTESAAAEPASASSDTAFLQAAMGAAATRLVDQAWQQQQQEQEESLKNKSTAESTSSACAASALAVSQALVTSLKRQFAAATAQTTTTANVSRQQPPGHDDEHEKKDDHDDSTDETTNIDLISVTPLKHDDDAASVVASSDSRTTTMSIPPTDLVAAFLRALRLAADDYLHQGKTIRKHLQVPHRASLGGSGGGSSTSSGSSLQQLHCTNVVVGVPAHYSRSQRQLMVQAARNAGFTGHVSTLTESTAAAMAYYGLFYSNSGRQRDDGRRQVQEKNKDHQSQMVESPSTGTQNNRKNDDDKQPAATNPMAAATATAAPVGENGVSSLSPTSNDDDNENNTAILVFDMGGGTTDVTIAEFITTTTTTRRTTTADTAVAASKEDDDDDTKKKSAQTKPESQGRESVSPTIAAKNDDDENDPSKRFRVVVTQGDGRLGGDDMDEALCNVVLQKLHKQQQQQQQTNQLHPSQQQQQPLSSLSEYQRRSLLRQCQRAKEELCNSSEDGGADTAAAVTIQQGQQQRIELTLSDLESAIAPLLERAQTLVTTALEQYSRQQHEQYYPEDDDNEEEGTIDNNTDDKQQQPPLPHMSEIILIGGATRVPAVRRMLRRLFDGQKELCVSVNAMAAVAQGAAIQAAILSKHVPLHELQSALMIDTSPHAIGVLIQTKSSDRKKDLPGDNDNDGQGEEHFVEILPKDSALPAMGYATFQLADPNQPGVTVMAVEEIRSTSSATTKPFYAPLGEFTFLLHRLKESERALLLSKNGGQRSVDIGMTLKEDGAFVVSIFDENDPEHIRKKQRYQRAKKTTEQQLGVSSFQNKEENDRLSSDGAVDDEPMSTEQILLLIGCLILFGLYVAAKLVFLEDLEQTSSLVE